MKIVIYSCVAGSYDEVLEPKFLPKNCEFVRFTDGPKVEGSHWQFRPLASPSDLLDPVLINRWHKFFPAQIFPDADWSIYIDGNIRVIGDLTELVDAVKLSQSAIGFPQHGQRETLQQEVEACRELGKFDSEDERKVTAQMDFYQAEGLPIDQPLSGNYLLVRHHGAQGLNEAMTLWWEQFNQFARRDQLSLPYVIWKTGLPVDFFNVHAFTENAWFKREPHKPQKRSLLRRLLNALTRRFK